MQKEYKIEHALCCNQWKIANQISIYALILFTIISLFSISLSLILLQQSFKMLKVSSNEIFVKESHHQIYRFLNLQKGLVDDFFQDKYNKLQKLNKLFHQVQSTKLQIVEPFDCLLKEPDNSDKNLISNVFCYGYCDGTYQQSDSIIDDYLMKETSLLTQLIHIYNFNQPYYTSILENQFFGITNGSKHTKSYKPQKRQWYIDHINKMNSGRAIIESQPYFSTMKAVHFALSTNLSLLNGTFVGVGAQDQDLSKIPTIKDNQISFQMVNLNDQLIISDLYKNNVSSIFNINQQDLTGISEQYWNQLKEQCQQSNKIYIQDFFNDKLNKTYLLSIIKIDQPQSYILIQTDNEQIESDQELLLQRLNKYTQEETLYLLEIFIFCSIAFSIAQCILITILNRDISKIQKIAKLNIYQDYFKYFQNIGKFTFHDDTLNLYQAYLHILDRTGHEEEKNKICQEIESIKFPQQNCYKIYKQLSKIRYCIHELLNFHKKEIIILQMKFIQNVFKRTQFKSRQIIQGSNTYTSYFLLENLIQNEVQKQVYQKQTKKYINY